MATGASDRESADLRHPDAKIPPPLAAGLALQIAALALPSTVVFTTVVFRAAGQPENALLWAVFAAVAAAARHRCFRRSGSAGSAPAIPSPSARPAPRSP